MANPAPLPPTVSGPIFTKCTQVLVNNVFPQSTVNVYETGVSSPIGTATTTLTSPTSIWVPVTTSLLHNGQQITATQEYTGTDPTILSKISANVESGHSGPVPIVNPPDPLPAPIFASGMCICMDWIYVDGLIPGASLTVTMGATPMVTAVLVTQSPQWFQLAAVATAGSVLEAYQTIGAVTSPTTTSAPPIEASLPLKPPVISPQPLKCQTNLSLSNLVPGADLEIINGGTDSFGTNTWSSMDLVGLAPLQVAASSAKQYFARCEKERPASAPFTVAPQAPRKPAVSYPVCQDVTSVTVSDVIAGEVLALAVEYVPTTTPPPTVTNSLGACPVSGPGPISLPPNWYPTGAVSGSVTLQIVGSLCGTSGPALSVPVLLPPGPIPPPKVQSPIYSCATSIFLEGANPGSTMQVWEVRPPAAAIPRTAPFRATTANFAVKLGWPLTPGDVGAEIYVTQTGCNTNGRSAPVAVVAAPKVSPPAVVGNLGYALPTDTSVLVKNVVPGAHVTLLLNGAPESQVDSIQAETGPPSGTPPLITVSVPVGSALAVGDVLTAGQTLCNKAFPTPDQGGGLTVQAPVPAPAAGPGEPGGGLGSNNNYFMSQPAGSGCANLINVSVKIQVTKEIVWVSTGAAPPGCPAAPSTGTPGMSFQLNCYSATPSASNPGYPAVQQYIINLWGTELLGAINTWNSSGAVIIFPGSEYTTPLGSGVPTSGNLPVGTYEIKLGNDSSGNVNSVTWVVNGVSYTTSPAPIPALLTANGLPGTDIAPIVAFTLDLVGPVNAESVVLSSGAGIITYSASGPLTVTSGEPAVCVADSTSFTCERATSSYSLLPANPANPFSQTFEVSSTTPLFRKMRGRPLVRKR